MPTSAIEAVDVDHVVNIKQMPVLLERLSREPVPQGALIMSRKQAKQETEPAFAGDDALESKTMPGPPTPLTCPECGGALWELHDGNKLMRYRCHVGHSYTPKGLLVTKGAEVESALWSALRTLEENAELRRRMAQRASEGKLRRVAKQYQRAAEDAEKRADLIRKVLLTERQGSAEGGNGDLDEGLQTPGNGGAGSTSSRSRKGKVAKSAGRRKHG